MKNRIMIIVLLFSSACQMQDSNYSYSAWSDEYPLSELPIKVDLSREELKLHADFDDIDYLHGLISIYLINNTDSSYRFSKNSISDFVLPEYKAEDNLWIRYQPFYYGWCGTPYVGGFNIGSKKFIKLTVEYSLKGTKKTIHYKLYDYLPLISNEGIGFVDSTTIAEVMYDDISFQFSDISFLTSIAYGYLPNDLDDNQVRSLRRKAIRYISIYYSEDLIWEVLYDLYHTDDEFGTYTKKILSGK